METVAGRELEYAELQVRRMAALKDLALVAGSSLDIQQLGDRLGKAMHDLLGATGAIIAHIDDTGERLDVIGSYGFTEEEIASISPNPKDSVAWRVYSSGVPVYGPDMGGTSSYSQNRAARLGIASFASLPTFLAGRPVGTVGLTWPDLHDFDEDERGFLESAVAEVAIGIENARLYERLREKDEAIRRAYVDVIEAVTGGKLVLMTPDEIEVSLGTALDSERDVASGRLTDAIGWLWEIVPREFPSLEPAPLIDAVGEALTNAVKHAQSGTYQLYRKDGGVQARVADQGPGIDFAHLPKATLQAGYSTAGTLGRGFDTMLKNCDRLLLSTQPGDTTLVLELWGR